MRFAHVLACVLAFGAAACSDGDGGGGGGGSAVSGSAVKGPVADAPVTIYALRKTGAVGGAIGSGTSSAAGEIDLGVGGYAGWALACVTGGSYVDEATGAPATIASDTPLYGLVLAEPAPVRRPITPLTTIAFRLMQSFAHDPEAYLDDSVQNAFAAVGSLFGLTDVGTTLPADLTAGPVAPGAAADHGAVLAGLSELAQGLGVDAMTLATALASDAGDGRFDGQDFGTDVPLGAGTLSPTAGTADLAAAIAAFLAGPRNMSGLTAADTTVDDTLAASSGAFPKPIQVRALADGYGLTDADVAALLEATAVPASPQVLIEAQLLTVTSQTATTLGFDVPSGLPLGRHDLVVRDQDTGLSTRLRRAVEVFDPDAAPSVTAIDPPAGPPTGGTFLEIRGRGLGPATSVLIDGVPAQRLAQDPPRRLVVATPPHAAGAVGVTVRNGAAEVVVPGAFEYRADDTRSNPDLPSATAPIAFGGFRLWLDAVEGVKTQALVGTSTFISFDSGSFSLTDHTASELAPAIATRQRGGQTFQSPESLGKAFLLFDATNGLSDFVRGFTNERSGVSVGATAFGPACFFPLPASLRPADVAGAYWVNRIEVNVGTGTVRQETGWLELDEDLDGSASLLAHGRDFGGLGFDLGSETWSFQYTLTQDGELFGLREDGAGTQAFSGRFSAGADLGFLIEDRADGTLAWSWLVPIRHGIEAGAWGGWVGGYLEHTIVDEGSGDESAFESGSYRGLIAGPAVDYARLSFDRATRMTRSAPEPCFSENVGAAALDVTPSGRVFRGDDVAGYLDGKGGILLSTGLFPNECLLDGGTDKPIASGVATFRHSRKSALSIEREVTQVAIEAKFLEIGTTHQQELGADLFDLTLEASVPPVVDGVPIPLAGTIPELAAATIAGLHKSTVRDDTGAVTTQRGSPPPWGVSVGYSFIDDELDLFATEITQAGGRFAGASMPRWVANGTLGNDGETAALRSSDAFLGDAFLHLVARRPVTIGLPTLGVKAVSLAFEPNAGGLSGVTSSLTDLQFLGGGTVQTSFVSQTLAESGFFTTDSGAGLGLSTTPVGQRVRIDLPNAPDPDREWETVWTPSGDAFFGIDDTPGLDRVEVVLGVLPALSGSFADDDHNLLVLELNPATSRATTQQLLLTPRTGSILTGELFTSRRDASGHKVLPAQSFATVQVSDQGNGAARVPFVGQIPVLGFLFNDREESAGQEELFVFITPRIIRGLDD